MHRVGGRRRSRIRVAVVMVVAVVLVLGAGAWGVTQVLGGRLDANVERFGDPFAGLDARPPTSPVDPATGRAPLNLLVVGSDSRISAGDPTAWVAGAQRTDTIMIVHLPADGGAAYVMSIPRDTWVDVPGHGKAKINAAFSYGGPKLLLRTVEDLTGVRMDHLAVADFESFEKITDELDGVEITLREDLVDRGRLVARAGKQLLTGEQALVYVRQRKNLARGDFDRVQRQQAWIRAIFARMRNEGTLRNPVRAYEFLTAVGDSVATDDGLTQEVLDDIGDRVSELGSTDITFFTVPLDGTGRSADGQSIVLLDRPVFDSLARAVAKDDVAGWLEADRDQVDVLTPVAP